LSRSIWFAPSQLAYLWMECKRCYWLHHKGLKRPRTEFAPIFNRLDQALKKEFAKGMRLDWLGIPGQVHSTGGKVCSVDLGRSGIEARVFGEYDLLVTMEGGGFGVYDFKVTRPNTEKIAKYTPQLSAYAFALENPDRHKPMSVTAAGLIYVDFNLATLVETPPTLTDMYTLSHEPVPLDVPGLRSVLAEMLDVIDRDRPPASGPDCPYCAHANRLAALAADLRGAHQ